MKAWPPSPTIASLLGPVPVVRVALAVEADQPLVVLGGPEDVVGEVAVAVVGGLLGDLRRADRAVPDERRHVVERPRDGGEAGQRRAEVPLPVDHVLAPEAVQQVVVLQRQRQALVDVLAEPRIDRGGVAAAQHQVHPPLREVLQQRVLLGDPDRVVRRDQRRRGGQDQPLRGAPRRRRGRSSARRRRTAGCGARRSRTRRARPPRPSSRSARRVDPLRLGRRDPRGRVPGDVAHREDSELHVRPLPSRQLYATASILAHVEIGPAIAHPTFTVPGQGQSPTRVPYSGWCSTMLTIGGGGRGEPRGRRRGGNRSTR